MAPSAGGADAVLRHPPLSPGQQQMLALLDLLPPQPDAFAGGRGQYLRPLLFRLDGPLDVAALQGALDAVGARHAVLRCRFGRDEASGEYMASVVGVDEWHWPLEVRAVAGFESRHVDDVDLADPRLQRILLEEAACDVRLLEGGLPTRALVATLSPTSHLLLITWHHVSIDGMSRPILARELAAAYTAAVGGQRLTAGGSTAPQCWDALEEERAWLASPQCAAELEYWAQRLAGVPRLELPIDAATRPPTKSVRGGAVNFTVDASTLQALHALGAAHKASTYALCMAALQLLMSRYANGQRSFAIGTPYNKRPWYPQTQDLIGYLNNMLAIVADLEDGPAGGVANGTSRGGGRLLSLAAHLARVKAISKEAFAHSRPPFPDVVAVARVPKDPSSDPIFGVTLAMIPGRLFERSSLGPGLRWRQVQLPDTLVTINDLNFDIAETRAGLECRITYCADLFDRRTTERMAAQYATLLSSMAAVKDASAASVWDLGMLAPPERSLLLNTLGSAPCAAAALKAPEGQQPPLVHEQFEAWAARQPSAPALAHWGDGRLSYGQLNARADALAAHLRRLGVGPDVLVVLFQERSLLFTTAQLAVLKAGGAFVPVDPATPEARVRDMLDDVSPRVVLTTRRHVDSGSWPVGPAQAAVAGMVVVCMDELDLDGPGGAAAAAEAPPAGWRPAGRGDLAYCIFTSGTTGRPKGVLVQHGSFARVIAELVKVFGCQPGDRVFQFLACVFDGSLSEVFGALCSGAELLLWSPPDFVTPMRELRATHVVLTPTALSAITPGSLPHVRVVAAGGEALPIALARAWQPHVERVVNAYGPTETTVACTFRTWRAGEPITSITLGAALPGYSLYVLDSTRRLAPAGAVGTLWIGGTGTARGYLKRPDLTAERFVEDPFVAGGRMYNSGDLARWTPAGELAYCGRADKQVKIRGYRIELGEVASVLASVAGVSAAAAVVRCDLAGNAQIVGYVAPQGLDEAPMRAALSAALPSYMQPAALVQLGALPRTRNGKVDEAALPDPAWASSAGAEGTGGCAAGVYEEPAAGLEADLAAIWCDVLGLARVGATDDFCAVGGTSLRAGVLLSRASKLAGGARLVPGLIYTCSTLRAMAAALQEAAGQRQQEQQRRLQQQQQPQQGAGSRPMTFGESQMLALADMAGAPNPQYNVPVLLRLAGPVDLATLQAALDVVGRRHEALRTVYPRAPGGHHVPAMLPLQDFSWPLEVQAVQLDEGAGSAAQDPQVQELLRATAAVPFALNSAAGPMLRALLLRVERMGSGGQAACAEQHLLLLVMHHIAADGASVQIVLRDLASAYGALAAGEPIEMALPRAAPQMSAIAFEQQAWQGSPACRQELSYWGELLAGIPRLQLPIDAPVRPPIKSTRGQALFGLLERAQLERLQCWLAQQGNRHSLYTLLVAAFQVLLSRHADNQRSFTLGTAWHGRVWGADCEGTVGYFVNPLALVANLTGCESMENGAAVGQRQTGVHSGGTVDLSLAALLQRVAATTKDAFAHSSTPFASVVNAMALPRDLSSTPLFQVMLVLQDAISSSVNVTPGLTMTTEPMPLVLASKFDLELEAVEAPEGLRLRLVYCPDLFDAARMKRMLGHFTNLLSSMAAVKDASAASVWDLGMLASPERSLLLNTLGSAPCAAAALKAPEGQQPPLVHEQFEAWAARQPSAPALAHWGDGRLSYGQLNARADALAAHLRRLGVGPDVLVVLFQERSLLFTTAQLAVLKAGGAFVPVDPATPEARVRDMLDDVSPRVVLTTWRHVDSGSWPVGPAQAAVAGMVVVCMDELDLDGPGGAAAAAEAPPAGWRPAGRGDLAYCIFTSGTTGRPKGVLVQHGGFARVTAELVKVFGCQPGDKVFQFLACVFDGSLSEVFGALCSGAELLLWSPPDFVTPMRELRATHVVLTPTALSAITPGSLPHVRVVAAGGEALPIALARAWQPHVERVVNAYGPTETTVACTFRTWRAGEPITSITLGAALPGYSLYVLDSTRRLAPAGAVGTLWIGGTGTARGYLKRPDLTAERFVEDPFVAGGRMYNSGDLARWTPAGELAYCGRADKQVKIRGYRIELGEVASVLASVAGVSAAAAVVRCDLAGNAQIVGYVAPQGLDEAPMRAALSAALPSYMQPAALVQLGALPRTRNGKVDEAALPDPAWPSSAGAEGTSSGACEEPAAGLEAALAAIWCDVLGLDRVGALEDFWRLGGNSLLAGVVVSRVRQELGADLLPATAIYTAPTVRALVEDVRAACPSAAGLKSTGGWDADGSMPAACTDDPSCVGDGSAKVYSATSPWVLLAQVLATLLAYVLRYAALVPVLILVIAIGQRLGLGAALALTGPVVIVAFGSAALLSIAVRWLLLMGRLRCGAHPLWSPYYLRWWAAQRVLGATEAVVTVVCGSPLHKLLLRAMGARIGSGVRIDTCKISEPELVEIGDRAVLEADAHLEPASLQPGHILSVGRIHVAPGTHLGQRSLVQGSCSVAGRIEPMTAVTADTQVLQEIKVAETSDADSCSGRHGLAPLGRPNSAAQTAGGGEVAAAAANVPPGLHLLAAAFVALLHGYAFMPCAAAVYYLYVGLKPFKVVGYAISHKTGPGLPWLQFLLCLIAVWRLLLPLSFYTLALLTKHALLRAPRMLASGQPDLSTTRAVLRHWVMGRIMESPLMVSALLLWPGTEASSCLLRALGARIGLRVLVEHPRCHEPDLLVLGHDSELGGDVLIEWGFTLEPFAGATHGVVAAPGCTVSSGAIVGDYSVLPAGTMVPTGEIWVGAPCAKLLRRNLGAAMLLAVARATAKQDTRDIGSRSSSSAAAAAAAGAAAAGAATADTFEAMRSAIVTARRRYPLCQAALILGSMLGCLIFQVPYVLVIWAVRGLFWHLPGQLVLTYFAALPLLALCGAFLQGALYVVLKWLVTGRQDPGDYEFYGMRHTRWLMYASAVALQGRDSIEMWAGSAIYSLYWRMLGARVGRLDRICLFAGLQPDLDMVTVGDGAVVAGSALVQGHTVENHTLSQAPIDIGPCAWVGTAASMLPGASLHARAQLAPLALVLKGEAASAGMRWAGIPAAPQRRVAAAATAEERGRQAALQDELIQLSMSVASAAALARARSQLRGARAASSVARRSRSQAARQASLQRQRTAVSGSITIRAAMMRAASVEPPV